MPTGNAVTIRLSRRDGSDTSNAASPCHSTTVCLIPCSRHNAATSWIDQSAAGLDRMRSRREELVISTCSKSAVA
jgi:hypothetical protein